MTRVHAVAVRNTSTAAEGNVMLKYFWNSKVNNEIIFIKSLLL